MNTKHTPGPWTTERRQSCHAIIDSAGNDLAYIDLEPHFFDGEPCGSVTSRGRSTKELAAIANMFSAAPDLLEACEQSLRALKDLSPACYTQGAILGDMLRAAIAKARET